jgi:hypothetical protein
MFSINLEDHRLFSLNYHYRGASEFWVIVQPSLGPALKACLATYLEDVWGVAHSNPPCCSQFVRHMSIWVGLKALDAWGIKYEVVEQRPGELIITAPGAYH